MSAFFSTLSCCWFWLLLGVLIGWLLNRWLCKCSNKTNTPEPTPAKKPESPPPAKPVETPAANVVAPTAAAVVAPNAVKSATTKSATIKPAATKPKTKATAKPKVAAKPATKKTSAAATIDIASAKLAGFSLKNANDLTVIEGIGPKINELFVADGIKTFAQLAEQNVSQMRAILDKGGSRFRIANPSSWAKQAKLASANKWAELKKLQDELSGGVKK